MLLTRGKFITISFCLLVFSGCLGKESGRGNNLEQKTQILSLGDSITAGNPQWDPKLKPRRSFATYYNFQSTPLSQYQYWANKANPAYSFKNCGVFGERTDQIANRFEQCRDQNTKVIIIQGGINNIAQGKDITIAANDLEQIIVKSQSLGLKVYLANVLPWNNASDFQTGQIRALNKLLMQIAIKHKIKLIDFNRALADSNNPNKMELSLTFEGDHPSIKGYQVLGELVAQSL